MRIEPEIGGASIVLLGSFNPKIFQPYWMAKHCLISDADADVADVSVIHQEITAFMIEDLFTLQVNPTRFSIERNVAPLVLITDVVTRLFGDLLPHVPMNQMGINRTVHFVAGQEQRNKTGLMLAPREPWGEWGKRCS